VAGRFASDEARTSTFQQGAFPRSGTGHTDTRASAASADFQWREDSTLRLRLSQRQRTLPVERRARLRLVLGKRLRARILAYRFSCRTGTAKKVPSGLSAPYRMVQGTKRLEAPTPPAGRGPP